MFIYNYYICKSKIETIKMSPLINCLPMASSHIWLLNYTLSISAGLLQTIKCLLLTFQMMHKGSFSQKYFYNLKF